MFGRLVEEYHVVVAKEQLCQFDAHTPSSRELRCGAVEVGAQEAESRQRALHLGLTALGAHHHVAFMGEGEAFNQFHVGAGLIVGAFFHLLLQLIDLSLHLIDIGEGFACLLAHRGVVLKYHNLWQIAHRAVVGHGDGACRRSLYACKDFEHG